MTFKKGKITHWHRKFSHEDPLFGNLQENSLISSPHPLFKSLLSAHIPAMLYPNTYCKVLSLMVSMTGQGTALGLSRILSSRASNQPTEHSMCESRKVKTGACATSTAARRARIRPSRLLIRRIFTFGNALI